MADAITKSSSMNTGHEGAYTVTGFTATMTKFKVNGIPPLMKGDAMIVHELVADPKVKHPAETIKTCSSKLKINGIPVATANDLTSCGDMIKESTCNAKFKC